MGRKNMTGSSVANSWGYKRSLCTSVVNSWRSLRIIMTSLEKPVWRPSCFHVGKRKVCLSEDRILSTLIIIRYC